MVNKIEIIAGDASGATATDPRPQWTAPQLTVMDIAEVTRGKQTNIPNEKYPVSGPVS